MILSLISHSASQRENTEKQPAGAPCSLHSLGPGKHGFQGTPKQRCKKQHCIQARVPGATAALDAGVLRGSRMMVMGAVGRDWVCTMDSSMAPPSTSVSIWVSLSAPTHSAWSPRLLLCTLRGFGELESMSLFPHRGQGGVYPHGVSNEPAWHSWCGATLPPDFPAPPLIPNPWTIFQ